MSAFEPIKSGHEGLDEMLDSVRLGDNVVWQVTDLTEFKYFANLFVKQAIADKRNLIYMRFANHEPLLEPQPGLKIYEFDPDKGFESFTVDIHNRIAEEGKDAFYVFDSLSSLQSAWYTDLMMGNFFRVTCPFLFVLDTVAYFPLLRGRHSYSAVAKIRDTTQLLLDIHSSGEQMYIHPLKVWNRYSPEMFLPHAVEGDKCVPLSGGIPLSRYYRLVEEVDTENHDQNMDSHDRFFAMARLEYENGIFSDETENQIIESTITKDKRLFKTIKQYFGPRDYFALRDRMIGSGAIGGKACGMLLARRIISAELPQYASHMEPHDSFYIGSDVFYTYIVSNNCWEMRIAQRTDDGYFSEAGNLQKALLSGTFPPEIREQFRSMLEYYGASPIIVRSSSFLEDGFNNAFAGKYETVFCVNQGTLEERMEDLENAVRRVYASTMDISALEYRRQRGLDHMDEQMAVLVQRVSGAFWSGSLFFPAAAGVGYSYSVYRMSHDSDPSVGLLRIVAGLGTRAVDRPENDYPRLSSLDRPDVSLYSSTADKHRYCQRNMDVLDIKENTIKTVTADSIMNDLPLWYKKAVMERDYEAEDALRRMGRNNQVWFIDCQKLLSNKEFTGCMQGILKVLNKVYDNPVDIEYTVNIDESGEFMVNLLQCRSLYTGVSGGPVSIPEVPEEDIFFALDDSSMGNSREIKIDVVIQIDPVAYYNYPYNEKPKVAEAVRKLNLYYQNSKKNILFMSPGRVGTSSPELGVPVNFASISGFCGICEVSDNRAGYTPELSYGSHLFQDLVEADIFYSAIWNDHRTKVYREDFLFDIPDHFPDICPEEKELFSVFRVSEPENLYYWNDVRTGKTLCAKLPPR